MMENEEILDDRLVSIPEQESNTQYNGWIRTIGMLLCVLGLLGIGYFLMEVLDRIKRENLGYYSVDTDWIAFFFNEGIGFSFGICLVVGGIGLIMKRKIGWVFGLAGTSAVILMPIAAWVVSTLKENVHMNSSGFFIFTMVSLGFATFAILLIWKPIRQKFMPSMFLIVSVAVITFLLLFHFAWWPLTR